MIKSYSNLLSADDITYIMNLPEVLNAKNNIDKTLKGSVYFYITLPQSIKYTLHRELNLNLFDLNNIPMRWIKGDTLPHNDTGVKSFQNTYLLYLTDNQGELKLGNKSYPIRKNCAYVFSEGLIHETVNTGLEPRLLLGPMSEEGLAVGAIINRPGGTTIYFRQTLDVEYSIDNQASWIPIGNNYPLLIQNTNTAAGMLKVEFVSDITFDDNFGGVNKYFICSSSHIQFGSESLKNDGTRPKIIIDGVLNYPGLIINGTSFLNGQSNINIFNLEINAINGSTLEVNKGWIAQSYFAKNTNNNYIINCSSNGNLPGGANGSGGIVGSYAASNSGELFIIGCSSSGNIGQLDGGIVGEYAGYNGGSITCDRCFTSGTIGSFAGGIFGDYAGDSGYAGASNCYTTGVINSNAGGIFGRFGGNAGQAVATNCYSLGNINTDAGGIFGIGAASDSGNTSASNCYSNGIITTAGNGIYGTGKSVGAITTNCYVANGSWNTTTANTFLTGLPNTVVGTTWVATVTNQPYELSNMGYTPYTINIIDLTPTPSLKRIFEETILSNDSTSSAIVSGKSYEILEIKNGNSGSYGTISINSTSGIISTTSSTVDATYDIYIRNIGSYNVTLFSLIVQGFIPCLTNDTLVLTPVGYKVVTDLKIGDDVTTDDNRAVKIKYISRSIVKNDKTRMSYIIPKNSIDVNYPQIETKISGDHLIKHGSIWIHPANSKLFQQDFSSDEVKYYHIELDNYETDNLVINYGLVVESYSGKNNYENFIIRAMRMKTSQ